MSRANRRSQPLPEIKTAADLCSAIFERFPALAAAADREHERHGMDRSDGLLFSWFERLADVLNRQIGADGCPDWKPFMELLRAALAQGAPEVREYIDTAVVERLFYQMPSMKARPYWERMPATLQVLYVAFFGTTP